MTCFVLNCCSSPEFAHYLLWLAPVLKNQIRGNNPSAVKEWRIKRNKISMRRRYGFRDALLLPWKWNAMKSMRLNGIQSVPKHIHRQDTSARPLSSLQIKPHIHPLELNMQSSWSCATPLHECNWVAAQVCDVYTLCIKWVQSVLLGQYEKKLTWQQWACLPACSNKKIELSLTKWSVQWVYLFILRPFPYTPLLSFHSII